MGIEQPAKYYDDIFATSVAYNDPNLPPPGNIWETIVHTAMANLSDTIYDFGCGPGQVCQTLYRDGFEGTYKGVDFSTVAIEKAQHRNSNISNASFYVNDITAMDVGEFISTNPQNTTVISTEFLEHVHKDIEFIAAIPEGVNLVFTVPIFDDPGHVRWFISEEQISDRYGEYIDNLNITFIPHERTFLFTGVRSSR